MKNINSNKKPILTVLIFSLLIVTTSCFKTEEVQPPVIPNFSVFSEDEEGNRLEGIETVKVGQVAGVILNSESGADYFSVWAGDFGRNYHERIQVDEELPEGAVEEIKGRGVSITPNGGEVTFKYEKPGEYEIVVVSTNYSVGMLRTIASRKITVVE